jgi:hypothetical protein
MPGEKPAKAQIINLDNPTESIECLFNPNEYTFSKQNTWNTKENIGKNVPQLEFGGGSSMTLKMELFFDTYTTGGDVSEITDRIWKLMYIDENATGMTSSKGRPPLVEFQWGSTWSFQAVITSITQKFTLFRHDGTPVRATLNVDFLQAKEDGKYPGQNPTTISYGGYRVRSVKEGDTLDQIAFEEYGDSTMWRYIADTNSLSNPLKLKLGQTLTIAPL